MPQGIFSTAPLDASEEWISGTSAVGLADRITGAVFADQGGTLYIEQSGNNSDWDISTSYSVTANDGKGFSEEVLLPYVRLRYVNGGTNQGAFRVYTRLSSAGNR